MLWFFLSLYQFFPVSPLETTRVYGNRKGIFTRERQPKAAARFLRCRYHSLRNNLNSTDINDDDAILQLDDKLMYCPAVMSMRKTIPWIFIID